MGYDDGGGDALAQVVGADIKRGAGLLGAGLVALPHDRAAACTISEMLGKRYEIEPLTKFSRVHDHLLFVDRNEGRLGGS